jgi:hypothetical protein
MQYFDCRYPTLDQVPGPGVVLEVTHGERRRCLARRAHVAVTGQQPLHPDPGEREMDHIEGMVDDGQHRVRPGAPDPNREAPAPVLLDDLCPGPLIREHRARPPGERPIRDQVVKGDNEPPGEPLRHHLVGVGDREIAGGIPVVLRSAGQQELRCDPGFLAGHLEAQPELDHELEQFVPHRRVVVLVPDPGEVAGPELAVGVGDAGVVEDAVDGIGSPLRSQDDRPAQDGVLLEP